VPASNRFGLIQAGPRCPPLGADHLDKLAVTRAVLEEGMRLYPPAPVMTREAASPTELGGKAIPAGANVVISIYAVHRHTRLWDDPDRFDPQRFAPHQPVLCTQFMPFARTTPCIGAAFAMMEDVAIHHAGAGDFAWDEHRPTAEPRNAAPGRHAACVTGAATASPLKLVRARRRYTGRGSAPRLDVGVRELRGEV
jgi:cytochrome P450